MATDTVTASVTELPESRVRVDAEVAPKELQRRVDATAHELGKSLRVPGFRRGKIPPPVVIRQLGRETVLDEAIRGSLGRWYVEAVEAAGIKPVGDPDLDLKGMPEPGKGLEFTFEIGVRPTATLGTYKGVEVGRREAEADEEAVDREIEALRERMARLETKEGAAEAGDFIVMDYVGSIDGVPFEGGEGRDQLLELGTGRLIPGFEDQLAGHAAGDEFTVALTFPENYGAEHLAGKDAEFAVTLKQVQEKVLPELDDAFAEDAAGFDTLAELREDIATKLREAEDNRIEAEFREAVLDAVVAEATVELSDALVEARAKELWDRTLHTLSHQGITEEAYLQIAGKAKEEILEEAKPEAAQTLQREAVIDAIIAAEDIEATDGDILDALQSSAAREGITPEKLRSRLEKAGRLDDLKADIAQRQALDLIAEAAKPISVEDAKAKALIWTPDKAEREESGSAAGGRKLWTPGDPV